MIEDIHLAVEKKIMECSSQIINAIIQNINCEEEISKPHKPATPADLHSNPFKWYITASTIGSSKSYYRSSYWASTR